MKTLGQIAFEGQRNVFPTESFMWRLIGEWENQFADVKACWEAAALAVKAECGKELEAAEQHVTILRRQLNAYRELSQPITGEPNDMP